MLSRLIYASEATEALNPEKVETLLAQARCHNEQRDITGMLIFNSRCFLQVLEGEREPLSDLYGRLTHDTRHRRLLLLGFESIGERLFPGWSMGFAAADASHRTEYLRFGDTSQFDPYRLTAPAALGLLTNWRRATTPAGRAKGQASLQPVAAAG
ncbi:MAG: BLUF domain-containing protein [Betaproteobacteria bacterium]|nr:BLUF domain-containing protein [Betaproteobacteria bacterium]